ncbi:DUF2797 domain-containing protein [Halobellus marinus]|uniref:DUF2797 domain-containing protein n=1 Tax=Halobellus TaxID=1073986 RepID=UPI0028A64A55|nr:DUF2797 domain-containing protein [Halobellus sp. DFY28]
MQIVGYDTGAPGLLVSRPAGDRDVTERESSADGSEDAAESSREVDLVSLEPDTELAYTLGDRHCAGAVTADGHIPCANPTAPYCPEHRSTWVCAKCTGTCLKDEMDCHEAHAIYLAAFAPDTFKVGVTREWRLETRLREQGADRGALLQVVPDGRIAREREAEIAESITDRVRVPQKRAGLHRDVDEAAWEALLAEFEVDAGDRFSFDYGLDLRDRPVAETIATGTVRGVKGRLLVLDRGGSTYAVDLRELVGYEATPEASTRDLQASLGAWD